MRWLLVRIGASVLCVALATQALAAAPQPLQTAKPDVIGGVVVPIGEAPWQVVFIWRNNMSPAQGVFCGGTLIDDRWILTAAHCFYTPGTCDKFDVDLFWVGAGSTDIGAEDLLLKLPKRIVENPEYDCKTLANDMALVELNTPVSLSARVTLASKVQASADLKPGNTVLASGWGLTENKTPSRQLLKVSLKVADAKDCRAHFGKRYPEGALCAGGGATDTCSGDSGGPLWVGLGAATRQLGVISKGEPCGKTTAPGIYTPVVPHLTWIEDVRKCVPSTKPPFVC